MISKTTSGVLMGLAFVFFALPSLANADSSLTNAQASAIIGLLQAFGADQSVILEVEQVLGVVPITEASSTDSVSPAHVPTMDTVYRSSNTGFDFSYNTPYYPQTPFSFGLVGVTHGKAFTQNTLLTQEYSWAQFGGGGPPTVYMNLNAPYGSTVAANIGSPQSCPPPVASSTEPTACEGYNYGYNAAKSALAYAASQKVTSPIWWLDIETANSWSDDTSVNDATIQGSIDYLNAQGIRVGVYSVPNMWDTIAGDFTPTQTIASQTVSIPTWLPIGITNQVGATNACVTDASFISGSPVWIVQYETSSTAVDQNYSC